jgi:hypothetical protein
MLQNFVKLFHVFYYAPRRAWHKSDVCTMSSLEKSLSTSFLLLQLTRRAPIRKLLFHMFLFDYFLHMFSNQLRDKY